MIPGVNVLGLALSVIAPQGVQLSRFLGRTVNAAGYEVDDYAPPVQIEGSMQPMPQQSIAAQGLKLEKDYAVLFTSYPVATTGHESQGDLVTFNGAEYLCERKTDWAAVDGWAEIICARDAA